MQGRCVDDAGHEFARFAGEKVRRSNGFTDSVLRGRGAGARARKRGWCPLAYPPEKKQKELGGSIPCHSPPFGAGGRLRKMLQARQEDFRMELLSGGGEPPALAGGSCLRRGQGNWEGLSATRSKVKIPDFLGA
jgi:hypothetical protein